MVSLLVNDAPGPLAPIEYLFKWREHVWPCLKLFQLICYLWKKMFRSLRNARVAKNNTFVIYDGYTAVQKYFTAANAQNFSNTKK